MNNISLRYTIYNETYKIIKQTLDDRKTQACHSMLYL